MGMDALIDCGALLSGASNRQAAEYLLSRMARGAGSSGSGSSSQRYKGVCYYHTPSRSWVIHEHSGRCLPRAVSPIPERDTFVIYDDARCRGADLQLHLSAVGLLTLGPGMTKDKLMQAAGRLRQLGPGRQSLVFIGTQDVTNKIAAQAGLRVRPGRHAAELTSEHMMRWVMANTVSAMLAGVSEYARKGLHYAATAAVPRLMLHDEEYGLEELYAAATTQQPVTTIVQHAAAARRAAIKTAEAGPSSSSAARVNKGLALIESIESHCSDLGQGHVVRSSHHGSDEECERELQREQEQEEEEEVVPPRVEPRCETDWTCYASTRSAASVAELSLVAARSVRIKPLRQFLAQHLSAPTLSASSGSAGGSGSSLQLCQLRLPDKVYCTSNFMAAVELAERGQNVASYVDYLRPVDELLYFPSTGELLLVSEREANGIREALLTAAQPGSAMSTSTSSSPSNTPVLVRLAYLSDAIDSGSCSPHLAKQLHASTTTHTTQVLPEPAGSGSGGRSELVHHLVGAKVFAGETRYAAGGGQYSALEGMVGGQLAAVEAVVAARGRLVVLPRSDLEKAAKHRLEA